MKEQRVLVVASCRDQRRLRTKGIDWLLRVARLMPDERFTLVGMERKLFVRLNIELPSNVDVIPYLPRGDLLHHYQAARVCCQPSFVEGLPNTLCEAMLCGCIPVGSDVGGIPTAIGNTGYLVAYGDDRALVEALAAALRAPEAAGLSARERIAQEFPVARREQSVYRIIEELCASSVL